MASEAPSSSSLSMPGVLALRVKMVSSGLLRLVTVPARLRRWDGAPTVFQDVLFATIRAMFKNMTIAQSRSMFKGTTETHLDLCRETKQTPKSITLDEVVAHWIGDEDADIVVFYLHGGGFSQPCTLGHMQYLHRLVTDMNCLGGASIAVLLPAYTLVPDAIFPTQLKQVATMLLHLLQQRNRDPSRIMIAGDSAGGNLVFTLLSHILHPRADVPRITLTSPFRAVFVFSPWVSFSTNFPSVAENAGKDILEHSMLRRWAAMYVGTADGEGPVSRTLGGDAYSEPLLADASWWQNMHTVAQQIYVWAGANELFVDSVRAFFDKLRLGWVNGGGAPQRVVLSVAAEEPHIGPIMDVMYGHKEKSESQYALEAWLREKLV
ncbi:alpha/beta-hydrolase [Pyrenochaeta sp. DS3sAY3a]|nr:alpha/beta-hydrolase [Pyrenochaeta sp. DS3sAY3a]